MNGEAGPSTVSAGASVSSADRWGARRRGRTDDHCRGRRRRQDGRARHRRRRSRHSRRRRRPGRAGVARGQRWRAVRTRSKRRSGTVGGSAPARSDACPTRRTARRSCRRARRLAVAVAARARGHRVGAGPVQTGASRREAERRGRGGLSAIGRLGSALRAIPSGLVAATVCAAIGFGIVSGISALPAGSSESVVRPTRRRSRASRARTSSVRERHSSGRRSTSSCRGRGK